MEATSPPGDPTTDHIDHHGRPDSSERFFVTLVPDANQNYQLTTAGRIKFGAVRRIIPITTPEKETPNRLHLYIGLFSLAWQQLLQWNERQENRLRLPKSRQ